ncbi:hypothetical protein [Actinomadura atramentaria]|uniref:DUF7737 domain-containing protein n=1 Tax=Actinomadura atramentaria TaxID=1990 RepID=UPI00039F4D09|nr:hypothetical protein [Actinomadura atramentaria]
MTFARRVDGTWRDAPLADVPAVLFSEAMRDVDLFTARTSVAPDPDAAAAPWWTRAEFGALTATAETRHAALARVLPRTPLADRCTLRARFLDVAGDLRTYRIHLGSGSVLRSPDDTHLDLTDVRLPAPPPVALPFADDRLTAILATAALLAADAAIDDPALLARLDTPADTPRAAPA